MVNRKIVTLAAVIALVATLSACSGGGGSTGGAQATTAATTAATPTSVAMAEQNALPLAVAAKVPAGLKCKKADIVWVNMHTKAFHDPGDPYYGKTKNGAYMCRADAVAQGDHPAGARHTTSKMKASPAPTTGY